MKLPVPFIVCAVAVASTGCGFLEPKPRLCTANFVYGIWVHVKDSVTGSFAASGAKLVARADSYADSMSFAAGQPDLDDRPLQGAGEHADLFTVTVIKPGYRDWVRTGVRVTGNECHVETTELTALIQPATS